MSKTKLTRLMRRAAVMDYLGISEWSMDQLEECGGIKAYGWGPSGRLTQWDQLTTERKKKQRKFFRGVDVKKSAGE